MIRQSSAPSRPNRLANRKASPFSKQPLAHAFRVMAPALFALTFASVAHAQGTIDFSGAQTLSILQRVAATRGMIAYSELASQMTTIRIEAFGLPMSEMLGEIGTEENAAQRGILTVIVVHKSGDMEPGAGFLRTSTVTRTKYL